MSLLIDTCTSIWIGQDDSKLSETARTALLNSRVEIYFSCVSCWEITAKHAVGKLKLHADPAIFIQKIYRCRILHLDLKDRDVLHLRSLPPVHKDPFDRMLICQALENDLTILTPDPLIRQYAVKTLW